MTHDLATACAKIAERAKAARLELAALSSAQRTQLLHDIASSIRQAAPAIMRANALDLEAGADLSSALLDRLALDQQRIDAVALAVDQIAEQPDPLGKVVDGRLLPNAIRLEKRRVPIGVILVIYESRPNVTADAAALCLKAGNAVILRGGKEAAHSNQAFVDAIHAPLARYGAADAVSFVQSTDRAAINHLLNLTGTIDLCIPRGGPALMKAVTEAAKIPVVKHDAGICHLYIDAHLDDMHDTAVDITVNAKAQRPGVCNAIETLLVHVDAATHVLPAIAAALAEHQVQLRADERALPLLPGAAPATNEDWDTEYLDLILSVRVVDSLEQAADHIRAHGSNHTEAIVTSSIAAAQRFVSLVDSANVMINCSTRFADGAEYQLGAEIGISTDKLHARGPMGAEDLTTFQWVLEGQGQIRS